MKDRYEVIAVTCSSEDSPFLEQWIATVLETSVLIEDGSPVRLVFGRPARNPLEMVLFEEALRSMGAIDITVDSLERKDWQELWKEQGFKRFIVNSHLTVIPAWDLTPASDPKIIIDPHVAFGTGWHETTYQSLALLSTLVLNKSGLSRVLDFGSGTGILGVAALRLDPKASLVAIDNDPYAVEATEANLGLNGMEHRASVFGNWNSFRMDRDPGGFGLIFANVTGGVICQMAQTLWTLLNEGGEAIFSGVSKEEAPEVEKTLKTLTESILSYPGNRYNTYALQKGVRHGP